MRKYILILLKIIRGVLVLLILGVLVIWILDGWFGWDFGILEPVSVFLLAIFAGAAALVHRLGIKPLEARAVEPPKNAADVGDGTA